MNYNVKLYGVKTVSVLSSIKVEANSKEEAMELLNTKKSDEFESHEFPDSEHILINFVDITEEQTNVSA